MPLMHLCPHTSLQAEEWTKEWLEPYCGTSVGLENIQHGALILKDISQLSTDYQTSGLEAYHSLMLHFLPKNIAFYKGMHARSYLEALDYNENSGRPRSVDTQLGQ